MPKGIKQELYERGLLGFVYWSKEILNGYDTYRKNNNAVNNI